MSQKGQKVTATQHSGGVSSGKGLPKAKEGELSSLYGQDAFSHLPEHHFSLFLARRTKTIHFIRHAEGTHNAANNAYGDDTPCTFSTEGSWAYKDAPLTDKGIKQCLDARNGLLLKGARPELVVVSPFTRTLQTAHIMFASKGLPFIVHDICRERWGKYTCDKRRTKTEILADMGALYRTTNEKIDWDSFAFAEEDDLKWTNTREADQSCTLRGVALLQWLAKRPEKEIAVVTHSSFLRHLFRAFGFSLADRDMKRLHLKSGNCEVRSVTLALHRGFYPSGQWYGTAFKPDHPSFRRGKWATSGDELTDMHMGLCKSRL